jgi:hypothetical protein
MRRNGILVHWGNGKVARINKDGTIDKRYKAGKELKGERKPTRKKTAKRTTKKKSSTEINKFGVVVATFAMSVIPGAMLGDWFVYNTAQPYQNARPFDSNDSLVPEYTQLPNEPKEYNLDNLGGIKEYMRDTFKGNYQLACKIMYGESHGNPGHVNATKFEHSVGLFQINLAEEYGFGWKVHWDKVPGSGLAEKTIWLQNPKNNIDLAYEMSSGGTSWGAWSAYTSGSYAKFTEECK